MIKSIAHAFSPGRCAKQAKWVKGALRCPCGNILALRYRFGDEQRVFIYSNFKKYQNQIMQMEPSREDDGEVVGVCCFDDFSDFIFPAIRALPTEENSTEDQNQNQEEDISLGKSVSEG